MEKQDSDYGKNKIWHRLHKDSSIRRAKLIDYAHRRPRHCSFQPSLVSKRASQALLKAGNNWAEEKSTFDRLYSRHAIMFKRRSDRIRNAEERNPPHCSFSPMINPSNLPKRNKSSIHHRLYTAAVDRRKKRDRYSRQKPRHCTFRPQTIGTGREISKLPVKDAHERLFADSVQRKRRFEKRSMNAHLGKEHTFHPNVNSSFRNLCSPSLEQSKKHTNVPEKSTNDGAKISPESNVGGAHPPMKRPSRPVFNRLYTEAVAHQKRQEKLQQRLPNHSFTPTLVSSPRSKRLQEKYPKRPFGDKLYEDAQRRLQKQEMIQRKYSNTSPRGCTFSPRINSRSERGLNLAAKSKEGDFGNRLYNDYFRRLKQMESQGSQHKECTFKPAINSSKGSVRGVGSFGDRLYGQWKQRSSKEKGKNFAVSKSKKLLTTSHQSNSRKLRKTSPKASRVRLSNNHEEVDNESEREDTLDHFQTPPVPKSVSNAPAITRKANASVLKAYNAGAAKRTNIDVAKISKKDAIRITERSENRRSIQEPTFGTWTSERLDQEFENFGI